jgi:hypothetical protein
VNERRGCARRRGLPPFDERIAHGLGIRAPARCAQLPPCLALRLAAQVDPEHDYAEREQDDREAAHHGERRRLLRRHALRLHCGQGAHAHHPCGQRRHARLVGHDIPPGEVEGRQLHLAFFQRHQHDALHAAPRHARLEVLTAEIARVVVHAQARLCGHLQSRQAVAGEAFGAHDERAHDGRPGCERAGIARPGLLEPHAPCREPRLAGSGARWLYFERARRAARPAHGLHDVA